MATHIVENLDDGLPLDQIMTICVDDDGIWHRPEYPRYKQELAAPKPFLVPSFDGEVVEVLPAEKQNLKIRFEENVHIMEIENRFQMMEPDERDDDDSYEIEIVEGSGAGGGNEDDADFYLEMIDGEIFYVFETEDDISVEDEYDSDESDESSDCETQATEDVKAPMQLNFDDMMSPNLHESLSCIDVSGMVSDDDEDEDDDEQSTRSEENIQVTELTEISSIADKSELTGKLEEQTATSYKEDQEHDILTSAIQKSQIPLEIETFIPEISLVTIDNVLPLSPTRNTESDAFALLTTPPGSPQRPTNGLPIPDTPPLTPRSILKASPASPTKSKKKIDKKVKKDKKDKTFTKTFVRAADFDGEHRSYSWEKPTWTNKQLRSTGKGDDIRKGGNLAQPITDAAKLIEKGQVKWEKPEWAVGGNDLENSGTDLDAKEELIRKIQNGTMSLPGMRNSKGRLKLSINGSLLAAGNDIVKPITKATIIKKPSNINYIANPKILRATSGGSKLWNGESLAGPVTQATTIKKYDWEKPSWAKSKLNSTNSGSIATKPDVEWEKPDWACKRGIGRTKSASLAEVRKSYTWEKPSWAKKAPMEAATEEGNEELPQTELKPTEKGLMARKGEKLELPITSLPQLSRTNSIDRGATAPANPRKLRRSVSDDF